MAYSNLPHVYAYCLHSPVVKNWVSFTSNLSIQYTPTTSNLTLRLTKDNNAQSINPSSIYNLTVLGLAEIANLTATASGSRYFPRSDQGNSTFATSFPPSNLQFMMTASDHLPVYTATDVLRGLQELTHYLYFLELAFEVFNDTNPTGPPIASGCLGYQCDSRSEETLETVQTRALHYVNSSAAANFSIAPSRQLQSSTIPLQLTTNTDEPEPDSPPLTVTYTDLKTPLPVPDQSFADIATRILAHITYLIIADPLHGDAPLPLPLRRRTPILREVDTHWGSNLAISLLPSNVPGTHFSLAQAAAALRLTLEWRARGAGTGVESKLEIVLDGRMVGWGCVIFADTSAWRCLMPDPGSTESVGSSRVGG